MARRLPSPPPVLSGFVHQHVLGSGGFADVYLFEQNLPRRKVAVKVLLSEIVDEQLRGMFRAEINVMAQLSAHPAVLTVFGAGVAPDGRPYMVMELCSGTLNDRYRRERIPVSEVLSIAVKIGSALETAHRSGVLHRDVKPSNILLTAYGHPVLSDFGIATALGDAQLAIGMSVPWSAPEILIDELPSSIRSEVYSFAATIYSLLAGRSPFETAGKTLTVAELSTRIDRGRIHPIGRSDVPASLERMLQRALSRVPAARPATIIDLVREFQACENELGFAQTPSEIEVTDWAISRASSLEEQTRVRAVATSLPVRRRRGERLPRENEALAEQSLGLRFDSHGNQNEPRTASDHAMTRMPRRGNRLVVTLAGVAILFSAGLTVLTAGLLRSDPEEIPVVRDLRAVASLAAVRFSWADPGVSSADRYLISSPNRIPSVQANSDFVIAARPGERVCATVTVTRGGRSGSPSNTACSTVTP